MALVGSPVGTLKTEMNCQLKNREFNDAPSSITFGSIMCEYDKDEGTISKFHQICEAHYMFLVMVRFLLGLLILKAVSHTD